MFRSLFLSIGIFAGAALMSAVVDVPVLMVEAQAAEGMAPDFTLRSIKKKMVTLSDYRGKVVLINFWATWCQPCQAEMPHLQAIYDEFHEKGFEVLSISIDESRDSSKVKPLIRRGKYTFPVLLDKQTKVIPLYNPDQTLPYNVLVDKEGKMVWTKLSYAPGEEKLIREKVMEELGIKEEKEEPLQETPKAEDSNQEEPKIEEPKIEESKPKETEPKD